jgi:hypothetical protein
MDLPCLAGILFCAVTLPGPVAAETDAQFTQGLIGTWMRPADDAQALALRSRGYFGIEKFLADGTGVSAVFMGAPCGVVVLKAPFNWYVSSGVLIETGKPVTTSDTIMAMDENSHVLRSLADGRNSTLLKTTDCNPPL